MTYLNYINRRKLIRGVGINDADYATHPTINGHRERCPFYSVWVAMFARCYGQIIRTTRPTYIGCTVIKEWHSFMAFKAWMETQDWKGKHLDKDVVYPGNKIYSPENCVFVSAQMNSLLLDRKSDRGKCPQGVSWCKRGRRFRAQISTFNKIKHLGLFESEEEASTVYREAKRLHILKIACCEPDIRVKQGLYRHSETYRSGVVENHT